MCICKIHIYTLINRVKLPITSEVAKFLQKMILELLHKLKFMVNERPAFFFTRKLQSFSFRKLLRHLECFLDFAVHILKILGNLQTGGISVSEETWLLAGKEISQCGAVYGFHCSV